MHTKIKSIATFWIFFLVVTAVYWIKVPGVPFHPDESTQIFTSADLDIYLSNPLSMAWTPESESESRMRYRLLDSPITRYLIGIGRKLTNLQPLPEDWNWSKSWEENTASGALPNLTMLTVSRFSVAFLFPFSMLLIYRIGYKVGGELAGIFSLILLAGNALILLHTRRAMAESAVIFSTLLFLWSLVCHPKKTWLLAISATLAFNSKQSLSAFLFIGSIAALIDLSILRQQFKITPLRFLLFWLISLGITILLNPFLWVYPLQAAETAITARQSLLSLQVAQLAQVSPGLSLITFSDRFSALVSQLFFNHPAVYDVSNYIQFTQLSETVYFQNPLHDLLRGWIGGLAVLFFTLLGWGFSVLDSIHRNNKPSERVTIFILITLNLTQLAAQCLVVSLPFQRYTMPLVPFVCIWTAYAITKTVRLVNKKPPIYKIEG
jgi:4-amino-4-deoxy-L-arabinose transferase-like glycosyltransferase